MRVSRLDLVSGCQDVSDSELKEGRLRESRSYRTKEHPRRHFRWLVVLLLHLKGDQGLYLMRHEVSPLLAGVCRVTLPER